MAVLDRRTGQEKKYMPELCRRKLLGYAESFRELARSLKEAKEFSREETGILSESSVDRTNILEQRGAKENRLLISDNLSEVAQIMTELADELCHYRPMEERCRRMLVHALRAESIYAEDFCYLDRNDGGDKPQATGEKGVSMTLHTDKKRGIPAEHVADMLSVLLRRPLKPSATSPYRVEQEPHSFVFVEETGYVAFTGFCKITKENETVSGDHYSVLESEKGKMTLLLSDGTGSGEQASADSERVLDLMEKLLEAGYCLESAVSMVNAAMLARGQEYSHPTLDVCDLDLYKGSCCFCKVGGAASFLKRGRKVEKISQGSLPLGIFRNVDTGLIQRQLQDGDFLILMTDGVLEALGENNYIAKGPASDESGSEADNFVTCGYEDAMEHAIAEIDEVNPDLIAEKLLQMALCCSGGHVRDDMTVLVAGIWKNGMLQS